MCFIRIKKKKYLCVLYFYKEDLRDNITTSYQVYLSRAAVCFSFLYIFFSVSPFPFYQSRSVFFFASSSLLVLTRPVCRNPGFFRFSAVYTGSLRFNCITDPIGGPNRSPLRFLVQPVFKTPFSTPIYIFFCIKVEIVCEMNDVVLVGG